MWYRSLRTASSWNPDQCTGNAIWQVEGPGGASQGLRLQEDSTGRGEVVETHQRAVLGEWGPAVRPPPSVLALGVLGDWGLWHGV